MPIVKSGDSVKVHYTGKFDNGEIFDSSEGGEPLAFTVGSSQVIPGFDQALVGMEVGETKQIVVPPEQGYGERIQELTQTIARDQFQLGDVEPEVGMAIEMRSPDGAIPLVITE